jgi:hypothetical protein
MTDALSPTGRGRTAGGWWRRFAAGLPMRTCLVAVATVWLLGCAWSFQEQSAFAASRGFVYPDLLPLVIDGFAVSMAGVSWAASLDARAAVPARLATVIAVGASSVSNGVWAYLRAHHDPVTVALGVAVPIAATMAFEVLLAEARRQVQRGRGLPAPVVVPHPRLIRIALAPWQTFRDWRALVLDVTTLPHPDTYLTSDVQNHQHNGHPEQVPHTTTAPTTGEADSGGVPTPDAADVSDLIEPGREVATELDRAGVRLSRRTLLHGAPGKGIEGLRGRGVSCSTDRAKPLLAALQTELGCDRGDHRAMQLAQLEVVS